MGTPPDADPLDRYILDALSEPAPALAQAPPGHRTVPVLHPDHGRWWSVELVAVGRDIAMRIARPRGDSGLIHQCLVSQAESRWSHQAGHANARARALDASTYSIRFPDDFDGPALALPTGSFHVDWSALYGSDNWSLLNNTAFRTVYRGSLVYY